MKPYRQVTEILIGGFHNICGKAGDGTQGVQIQVKDHATGAVVTTLDTTWMGRTFQASFSGIGASAMRTEFDFVTLVNGIETGNVWTWSVEAYVGEIRSGGNQAKIDVANALLTYGDAAAGFFTATNTH